VDIVRSSSVDFQFVPTFEAENKLDLHYIAEFRGFIHPPLSTGSSSLRSRTIKLYLIAAAARAYLYLSTNDDPQLKVLSLTVVL